MWSLMTLTFPQMPPEARGWLTSQGEDLEQPSYGTYLLSRDFDSVDRELRETVVRCMAHNPAHRPPLRELELLAESKTKWDEARNAEVRRWAQEFFSEPLGS